VSLATLLLAAGSGLAAWVATESDHEIQLYQPDLVVQAIKNVIGEGHR